MGFNMLRKNGLTVREFMYFLDVFFINSFEQLFGWFYK